MSENLGTNGKTPLFAGDSVSMLFTYAPGAGVPNDSILSLWSQLTTLLSGLQVYDVRANDVRLDVSFNVLSRTNVDRAATAIIPAITLDVNPPELSAVTLNSRTWGKIEGQDFPNTDDNRGKVTAAYLWYREWLFGIPQTDPIGPSTPTSIVLIVLAVLALLTGLFFSLGWASKQTGIHVGGSGA